jgi:lipopolysaccharide export system permease protein
MMLSSPTDKPQQLDRIYYKSDILRIRDVANHFTEVDADTAMKGDREMSVCEMQKEYGRAITKVHYARYDSLMTAWRLLDDAGHHSPQPVRTNPPTPGGIGALYCTLVHNYLKIPSAIKPAVAHAAEVPKMRQAQDTTKSLPKKEAKVPAVPPQRPNSVFVLVGGQYVKVAIDRIPAGASFPQASTPTPAPPARATVATPPGANPPGPLNKAPTPSGAPSASVTKADTAGTPSAATIMASHQIEINDARMRIDQARHEQNRYAVEIQKKFSLAAACIVLVLVGAPIALRFPNGGVGLVFGVSFFIFAIYYVGLIGGEALSDRSIIPPFWAMWADNIVFTVTGLLLMIRMGNEGVTSRGGGIGEAFEKVKSWFHRPELGQVL